MKNNLLAFFILMTALYFSSPTYAQKFTVLAVYPGEAGWEEPKVTDMSEVIIEFYEEKFPGIIKAEDLTVNGSPAHKLNVHENLFIKKSVYTFSGYAQPPLGKIEIALNVDEVVGKKSWKRWLFDPKSDDDQDGLNNKEEIEKFFSDPTNSDTDSDGLPDAYEIKFKCLSVFTNEGAEQNNYGTIVPGNDDTDHDGIKNVDEFKQGTNPCE